MGGLSLDAVLVVAVLGLTLLVIVAVMFLTKQRGWRPPLRELPAYRAMNRAVGESVESDRAMHFSLGAGQVGDAGTLTTLAGAESLYWLTARAAIGDRPPLVTFASPLALPIVQHVLRRAYALRQKQESYDSGSARWVAPDPMAFAAGANCMMVDDLVSSSILVGSFGPELALIGESGARGKYTQVAVSDRLEGQAVAYAISDEPLIGEEMFVGGAYLSRQAVHLGSAVAQDVLRWLVVLAILGAAALKFLGLF